MARTAMATPASLCLKKRRMIVRAMLCSDDVLTQSYFNLGIQPAIREVRQNIADNDQHGCDHDHAKQNGIITSFGRIPKETTHAGP